MMKIQDLMEDDTPKSEKNNDAGKYSYFKDRNVTKNMKTAYEEILKVKQKALEDRRKRLDGE